MALISRNLMAVALVVVGMVAIAACSSTESSVSGPANDNRPADNAPRATGENR